jgi:UTP--glucose-1-phosphate uridylyltransferase
MSRVRKAVIPAAGLGTRFLPATKAVPKEMLPIVDVPTLQLIVEEALDAGIEEIVLVTGRGKASIEDHFDHSYELEHTLRERGKKELLAVVERISKLTRLVTVRQKEPLGLGHAVLVARQAVGDDEPVAVLLGDDLYDCEGRRPAIGQLIDEYERLGGDKGVVSLMEVPAGQEQLYGIVAGKAVAGAPRTTHIDDMVEKPAPGTAPSRLAIVGRYVLPSSIWQILQRTQPGKGGEIQLTDALKELAQKGGGCYGLTVDGTRHDAGDKLGYLGANLAWALKRDDLRPGLLALMRRLVDENR